jgi:hypothetical protein
MASGLNRLSDIDQLVAATPPAMESSAACLYPHDAHRVPSAMFSPRGFPQVRHITTSAMVGAV